MKKIFLNLGKQPLANSFLPNLSKKTIKQEFFYNLRVSFNENNYLVSVSNPVNPKLQYTDNYAHRASESLTMRSAFKKTAKKLKKRFNPRVILEIGSNDGVFIKNFDKSKVIAVEPCKNLADLTKKQFKTYPNFWNKKLAKKIFSNSKKADLIFSANTISHIPNLNETFKAINLSLSERGVLVIEDPSLFSVIKNNSYDQFYDEHVYLFSTLSIFEVVKEFNLRLFHAERVETHGGSMRYYICKKNAFYKKTKNLTSIIKSEKIKKLHKFSTYKAFSNRVQKSKKELLKILNKINKNGKKIISYGATYKSTTVFNYCNINSRFIKYVTDTTLNKQGRYTPGMHIPIISPERGMNETVDYAFLGAWNFKKEIFRKEKKLIKKGARFITHVPWPRIIRK